MRILNIVPDADGEWPDFLPLPINPNQLFEEISFDPRLWPVERNEREAEFRALGYTGAVTIDPSYQKIARLVTMMRDWAAP